MGATRKIGRAMSSLRIAATSLCLLASVLAGCSLSHTPPVQATPISTPDAAPKAPDPAAYKAASDACHAEAQKKGIGSILGIFSHLRPGAANAEFIACMKRGGFEVQE
jgi:hypothetical protein